MDSFNVCGIVCEYNPFHKGHIYQIQEARERSRAEFVIAVMSGNFVQRGEPAIIDKWARTQMAIKGGADIVIELPTPFAVASAEFFAYGAMNVLKKTGVVTHVSFGSESFDGNEGAEKISRIAKEDVEIDKELLDRGMSYAAAARNESNVLPNDLLGIEYVRAGRKMGFSPLIVPVKRVGSSHDLKGSAKYIRKNVVLTGEKEDADRSVLREYMPDFAADILIDEIRAGRGPVTVQNMENIILADLRRKTPEDMKNCPFVSEGIEYKILSEALKCNTFEELIAECTSKRYTSSRIRRIVLAALFGVHKDVIRSEVPYIRVLGMNKNAGRLMKAIKINSVAPVITSKADFIKEYEINRKAGETNENSSIVEFLKIENNAAEIYSLAYPSQKQRTGASEMTHPLIFLKND